MRKLFLFIAAALVSTGMWAATATYVPLGKKTVTADETIYCTDITAAGNPATSWVVVPNYGTENVAYTQITSATDKGNPDGITDNLSSSDGSVAMIKIKADGNTYSSQNRVVHMHVTGVVGVIAHGNTGSSSRGLSIAVAEFNNNLSTFPTGDNVKSFTRSNNSGSLLLKKDGLDASKEYVVSIYAAGGDTRFYAVELIAPDCGDPNPSIISNTAGYVGDAIDLEYSSDNTSDVAWDVKKNSVAAVENTDYEWVTGNFKPLVAGTFVVTATQAKDNATPTPHCAVKAGDATVTLTIAEKNPVTAVTIGEAASATVRDEGIELSATATNATEFQWFIGEDEIDGATSATYTFPASAVGTYNLVCKARNDFNETGVWIASSPKAISVKPQAPTLTASAYFADSKSVTIAKAAGEAAAAEIKYSTDGENWNDYSDAIEVTATTTIYAKVVQGGLESTVSEATYTKFVKSDLASISGSKTWTIPTSLTLELKDDGTTIPAKYDEYYTYSDIATLNGNDLGTFDGTTLAFSGQYPYRGSNGSQNGNYKFITTVPGTLTVEFSNTGGSNKGRWVKVNDTKGKIEADGTTKRTEDFTISAGTVIITHVNGEGELSAGIRVFSLNFVKSEETALDNTTDAVKAVKFFENGQLFIRRGNKVYDVTGQEIR